MSIMSKTALLLLAAAFLFTVSALAAERPAAGKADANAPAPKPAPAPVRPDSTGYSGNVKTRTFHASGCRYFQCKSCTAHFASAEEARSNGYAPCKRCIK